MTEARRPEVVSISPRDESSDREQSDADNLVAVANNATAEANNATAEANNASAVASRKAAILLAAFTHATVVRFLLATFALVVLNTVIDLYLLWRAS